MGQITITIKFEGSFGVRSRMISPGKHGHQQAVADAITYQLRGDGTGDPARSHAIEGHAPSKCFGRVETEAEADIPDEVSRLE